ncbi:MAG: hypothetical protein O3B72_07525, partial [Proteobacteria bacterium]|nr:hypothetical protein [Pseudomonadota bacterium]
KSDSITIPTGRDLSRHWPFILFDMYPPSLLRFSLIAEYIVLWHLAVTPSSRRMANNRGLSRKTHPGLNPDEAADTPLPGQ